MNKTISVYELLGLIKDGKAPKKIKYDDEKYRFDSDDGKYYRPSYPEIGEDEQECYDLFEIYDLYVILNDKVEILEENKPIIETIKRKEYQECGISIVEEPSIKDIVDKINEIIDHINKKEG